MALSYEPVLNGYNIWTAEVLIPVYGKRKDGSKYRTFMRKSLNYTDVKSYWRYEEDPITKWWCLYRIDNATNSKRLVYKEAIRYSPESIIAQISAREISFTDAKRFEQKTRVIDKKIALSQAWSVEFDGKNVLGILALKPKCIYKELLNIIHNEGGYVDSEGIVHKGEAVSRTVEL